MLIPCPPINDRTTRAAATTNATTRTHTTTTTTAAAAATITTTATTCQRGPQALLACVLVLPLERHLEIFPGGVWDAHHQYRTCVVVGEVDAFAHLPAAHGEEDCTVRGAFVQCLGVLHQRIIEGVPSACEKLPRKCRLVLTTTKLRTRVRTT